jgi:predicted DNA-binding transcriptional regulator YafY
MRASRLLQILLLLQNRGRLTAAQLSRELEVDRRTILRDVDALNEAGLPILTQAGHGGGINLGFDYRTRLTGLDHDEAEAMAVILAMIPPELVDLGLAQAGARAQAKLREAFPDQTRRLMAGMLAQFPVASDPAPAADARRAALGLAVRQGRIVRLRARGPDPILVHPAALELSRPGWVLVCARTGLRYSEADWGDINISARRFAPETEAP